MYTLRDGRGSFAQDKALKVQDTISDSERNKGPGRILGLTVT